MQEKMKEFFDRIKQIRKDMMVFIFNNENNMNNYQVQQCEEAMNDLRKAKQNINDSGLLVDHTPLRGIEEPTVQSNSVR